MKKALIAAALWMGAAGPALAVGGLADVTLYDRTENRALPLHYHEGRHYVVGKPGNEYQLNVRSNQSGEILAVISVDGVNAVSGVTADWGQTGYVLGPYTTYAIKGWRKSLQRIAAFFFTEHENSYAARTGRPDNVGVIGVAVFRKKVEPPVSISREQRQRLEAPAPGEPVAAQDAARESGGAAQNAAPESARAAQDAAREAGAAAMPRAAAPTAAPEKNLGTGHGRSEASPVRHTKFERATASPEEVISIYYDTYRNLVAQGVIRDVPRIARPSPFPGQFVPDPR